jgi:mannose-6-phosphate isomerase-like protein (cupin superfamily)
VVIGKKSIVLVPGEGKTLRLGLHQIRLIHRGARNPYSLAEWLAPPAVPGPPLHVHRETDEAFYVLDGTFGFQMGDETIIGPPGAFVFIPNGLPHTYWNQGPTPARLLVVISPAGFESYFEELSEELASAGDSQDEAMRVRRRLSAKYDIDIVGPPRQADG